jgi:hypothetical protein
VEIMNPTKKDEDSARIGKGKAVFLLPIASKSSNIEFHFVLLGSLNGLLEMVNFLESE